MHLCYNYGMKITLKRGNDRNIKVTVTKDGNAVDVTGWQVRLTVKKKATDPDASAIISKLVTSIPTPTAGIINIPINAADTENQKPGSYQFDILVLDGTGKKHSSDTGTLSLFGWNYYHLVYDGTTATQAKFDTQRRGYNTGDTTATINTTASPGHLAIITGNDMMALLSDQLVASATGVRHTVRASRDENVPDDTRLYLQIRMANGSTAPASQTTWTIGMVAVSEYSPLDTTVQDLRQTTLTPIPVDILRSVNLTTSTTVTANQGTLQAGTNYNAVTTASTNGASVKASAGNLFELSLSNPTATPIYVKLYNKASAPTVGTDVPVKTIPVPANTDVQVAFGSQGKRFATGLAIAATGAIGATDTTNAVAGVQINGTYI